MRLIGRVETAHRSHQTAELEGGIAWSGDMIGEAAAGQDQPYVNYIHQQGGVTLERHFHDAYQFQVFVRGGGRLGFDPVGPFSVHFTTYQTVYGPIVAGEEGLDYLTLRLLRKPHIRMWPQERGRIEPGGARRQLTGEAHPVSASDIAGRSELDVQPVIPAEPGGLASWRLVAPPGRRVEIPGGEGGGRFVVLIAGGATSDGEALGRLDTVFVPAGEDPVIVSGPDGAGLLVLQLPQDALKDLERSRESAVA